MRNLQSHARRYAFTLGHSLRMLAAGPLSAEGRKELKGISKAFGWNQVEGALPIISASQIWQRHEPVLIAEIEQRGYNVTAYELTVLCQLSRRFHPAKVFEFGTFDGRSSVNLLLNSPEAHLYTLDLPPDVRTLPEEAKVGERLRRPEFEGRYTQLFGDSRTLDFSPYAGQMDLVFIDAGHEYEFVKSDTDRALELIRPAKDGQGAGVIVWHDFGQIPGVTRAVEELYASGKAPGELVRIRQTSLALCLPRGIIK